MMFQGLAAVLKKRVSVFMDPWQKTWKWPFFNPLDKILFATDMSMLVLKVFRAVACPNQQFIHGDSKLPLHPHPTPPAQY